MATEEEMTWQEVHARLTEVAFKRAALDYEEATLLVAAARLAIHAELGYGSLREYVELQLGYPVHDARERVRVAKALADCPKMARALRDGELSWSAARELTRVADSQNEAAWLERVRGRTVRAVERLVSGHLPGDLPDDPVSDDARRHVLRLEVSGATLALYREAREKLVRETGRGVDDEDVVRLMARQVLGGPTDSGRSSYQIAMVVCESCGRGWQQGAGERIAVEPAVVEQARCDAQHVGRVDAQEPAKATQDIPPAIRRQVLLRDGGRCVVPGCANTAFLDVHHLDRRADGGGDSTENLATTCDVHHGAVHSGRLLIEGRPSTGLTFRHADGTSYGGRVSAELAGAAADAFLGLKSLGFKEKDARRAMNEVMTSHVGREPTVVDLLKLGLAVLCPPAG